MTTRLPVGVFFALFTVSGFSGLIYQSIWSHYLKLFLGHAAYAQTLVLAIFMGGMALGAWLTSRYSLRIRNLLRGYAIAELGIGVLALAFHGVFVAATAWAFDSVLPSLGGFGVDAFKWSLAALLILPASILLGTTFPLMSAGIMRAYPELGGGALSMLYFTNSFGAALGVLASGFFLIERAGLPGTILVAGAMNVVLALTVWLLARTASQEAPAAASSSAPAAAARLAKAVLALAFLTGTASFIYEITWIRMLTLLLGASTHSFEVMLAAFILAMSLGAFWFRNRVTKLRDDVRFLAGLLLAKAVFAVGALYVYDDVIGLFAWFMQATSRTDGGYTLTTAAGLVASTLVMFPAAFCAGMSLPLATQVLTSRGFGEASIGKVYAANTAGCIAGAAFATHLGMELAGLKGLTGIGAMLDAAAAVLVFVAAGGAMRSRPAIGAAALTTAAAIAFLASPLDLLRMHSGVFRHGVVISPEKGSLKFHRDGKTASISVIDLGTWRSIRTNGKPDASIEMSGRQRASPDEYTMALAALLPLAHKPDARTAANIGFGSGLTTHTLLASPRLQVVDNIEIERAMVDGARLYAPRNDRAFADPRSRIFIEDAKTFFAARGSRYDLIISEPSNPWVSGTSTLFSREFYKQIRRHLNDDGLLVQWIQYYEINLGLVSTVFQALAAEFGDYVVYGTTNDLLIVATPGRRLPPARPDFLAFPAVKEEMAALGIRGLADLDATRVGSRAVLHPLLTQTGYPANSDFFPILDQRAPRARYRGENATDFANLRNDLSSVLPLLEGETRFAAKDLPRESGNRLPALDNAMVGAEAIEAAVGGDTSRLQRLPARARTTALLVHAMLDNCRGASKEFVGAVAYLARLTVPYLRAEDVAVLFDAIRGSPCHRSLDAEARAHLAFLDALNRRDAEAVAKGAESVLAATVGESPLAAAAVADAQEVLAAGLGARLAQGQLAEASALRNRYLPKLGDSEGWSLNLRVALAIMAPQGSQRAGQSRAGLQ